MLANATSYQILQADASNARRIYGIHVYNTTGAPVFNLTGTFGTSTAQGLFNVTLAAGSNDIFGAANGAPIFQKQKDANGVPYYNIPAGHALSASISTLANSTGSVVVFGETYA